MIAKQPAVSHHAYLAPRYAADCGRWLAGGRRVACASQRPPLSLAQHIAHLRAAGAL